MSQLFSSLYHSFFLISLCLSCLLEGCITSNPRNALMDPISCELKQGECASGFNCLLVDNAYQCVPKPDIISSRDSDSSNRNGGNEGNEIMDGQRGGEQTGGASMGGEQTGGEQTGGVSMGGEQTGGEQTGGVSMGGEQVGGEQTGGISMGGEQTGGEQTGGVSMSGGQTGDEVMGGTATGGELMGGIFIEDDPALDTPPLNCSTPLCPAARIVSMDIPRNSEEAEQIGCTLVGFNRGASLDSIFSLLGSGFDLNSLFQPDDTGEIEALRLFVIDGWLEGQSGNQTENLSLHLYSGTQTEEARTFSPLYLEETSNHVDLTNGHLTVRADLFNFINFTTDELPSLFFSLLAHLNLSGSLTLDDRGFNLSDTLIEGYMTREIYTRFLTDLYMMCSLEENRPQICDTLNGILSGIPEVDLNLFLVFTPFDAYISEDGHPQDCTSNQDLCNALSLCYRVELESVLIRGMPEEP